MTPHPLPAVLLDAAAGRFPPVDPAADVHGRGRGRSLLADALRLVPAGEPVFAAVTPGNARSLRAFLACGFVPVGGEIPLRPEREPSRLPDGCSRLVSRDSGLP